MIAVFINFTDFSILPDSFWGVFRALIDLVGVIFIEDAGVVLAVRIGWDLLSYILVFNFLIGPFLNIILVILSLSFLYFRLLFESSVISNIVLGRLRDISLYVEL